MFFVGVTSACMYKLIFGLANPSSSWQLAVGSCKER
ncbi:hypothetical protein SLEP1_g29079 [Rubroshorea leprosula]|uniref:Uncharacterized protein n=1 Tax=Rubroshorea leprosula TaxID=152421 RepID=A0AAV5JVS2_9ROSI|nr:hypothetical protein SLEP1_g29079 [Rubroshorea leprosula]